MTEIIVITIIVSFMCGLVFGILLTLKCVIDVQGAEKNDN